jgi:rare lipoprotein A
MLEMPVPSPLMVHMLWMIGGAVWGTLLSSAVWAIIWVTRRPPPGIRWMQGQEQQASASRSRPLEPPQAWRGGAVLLLAVAITLLLALAHNPAQARSRHHGQVHNGAQLATWYGPGFYGHRTACGEVYTGRSLTAAHRTLRCGTLVRVTNLLNHRTITVRINDRGPYSRAVIDLSPASRDALGAKGTIPVSLGF